MSSWRITIEGHGIHHNKRADDANVMAAKFVEALRSAGHEYVKATFELTSPASVDDLGDQTAAYIEKHGPTS